MRVLDWLDGVRHDVIVAWRQVWGAPAMSAIAVATLAVGVGVNSAVFALVDATLLRPLPYPAADRLVMISERTETAARSGVSPLNLLDWQARSHSFDALAGFVPGVGGMVMAGRDGSTETVPRQWVTAGVFDVVGVKAIVGRTFTANDDATRATVAVLSEAFWRSRFAGDPSVVGRHIRFDGDPYTIVGVVPSSFQLVGQASMWALAPISGRRRTRRLNGFARWRNPTSLLLYVCIWPVLCNALRSPIAGRWPKHSWPGKKIVTTRAYR